MKLFLLAASIVASIGLAACGGAPATTTLRLVERATTDVVGDVAPAKDSVLAITGGTGEYTQARGSMALHARNPDGTEYDFVYTIIR